jgi:hypothetical protein
VIEYQGDWLGQEPRGERYQPTPGLRSEVVGTDCGLVAFGPNLYQLLCLGGTRLSNFEVIDSHYFTSSSYSPLMG